MKKLLLALVILATAFSVPAVSVKTGIGPISSLGVSFSTGRWDFSADVRSSFPVLPLAYPEARASTPAHSTILNSCPGILPPSS